jgi:hypothetical protein
MFMLKTKFILKPFKIFHIAGGSLKKEIYFKNILLMENNFDFHSKPKEKTKHN